MKIDEKTVKMTPAPAKGAATIWDAEVKGFGLRVFAATPRHPTGAKSFFLNYRNAGIERRLSIGSYPTWTAVAARAEAKELRKIVDRGGDPAADRAKARSAATVADLAERYKNEHLSRKAPASQAADLGMLKTYILPAIGKRRVVDVHPGDIGALHKKITDTGKPVHANRVLSLASKMFAIARNPMAGENDAWRNAVQGNPCAGIERNQEHGRTRFFSTSEIVAVSEALAKHKGPAADALRLCMLTGARPGEVLKATWGQFDAEPGVWVKPASTTKQRATHRAPLSPPTIELIDRLRSQRADGAERVFPLSGDPKWHFYRCWEAVRTAAGLEKGVVPYAMRHTFAATGASGGMSLLMIGKLLGHGLQKTTQRYAHLADDPLRAAATKIGNAIANAGKDSGNVEQLRARK